ncbi:DUF2946 domain-containing protein [Burkholderia ambifaria]|uniref:DUF2946 domain-containing protein n=1 Tax=Burkholderia ambifaria MEX-5 TaxID=396597 RepID=B1T3A1_9BURK|nr:DUF2946 domain-containing protein [Burkholderia ambifaria]EDT41934.1 conserved hypothetical protein [Burkholderia ambifaria MEX-5]
MTRTRRVALTAWAGLISIWLALVAPVVTQWLAAYDQALPIAALCSTSADTGSHPSDHPVPGGHQAKTCGYCNLLAHHPPLSGPGYTSWIPSVPGTHEIAYPTTLEVARARFFTAPPRGPPVTAF